MSFFKVHSAQADLISARQIDVEVDISNGLFAFNIVGLGDKAVGEAKDRITSAIKYSGFKSPKQKNQKVVISLAPANRKKVGVYFDLAMAVAYLAASGELSFNYQDKLFIGELSLNGETRKTGGIMQITKFAAENGFKEIYLPHENFDEASFIKNIKIFPIKNLAELILHLKKDRRISTPQIKSLLPAAGEPTVDMADIFGQELAKRGLLIAASGKHNIAFYGPPGTGKTMLARAFAGILPDLLPHQIIETTSIYSFSGFLQERVIQAPPFRAPHHTSSYSAVIGGYANSRPGEITLAHNGLLFLDEFPEFDRRVINALREPLEEKQIGINRAGECRLYPADFILIAAMNPCPCGYYKTEIKPCICSPNHLETYQRKIAGPIIDRIDLWIEVNHLNYQKIFAENQKLQNYSGETSRKYKEKVMACRQRQRLRNQKLNGDLNNKEIKSFGLESGLDKYIIEILDKYKLSMRSFHKILKIARTIADLADSSEIKKPHILEAVRFRSKKY